MPLRTFTIRPVLLGNSVFFSGHISAFVQTHALSGAFYKAAKENEALALFGENVVTAEGDVWKRHRRITAPAFSSSTHKNVWETTERVYADIIESEGWNATAVTPTVNANTITHKVSVIFLFRYRSLIHSISPHQFALFLISIAAFGIPMSWAESHKERDARGQLTVQATIFSVANYIMERAMLPRWIYVFGTEKLKLIEEAYKCFDVLMHGIIEQRATELDKLRGAESGNEEQFAEAIKDVLGRLVNARRAEGKNALSEEEIIGNSFIFVSSTYLRLLFMSV